MENLSHVATDKTSSCESLLLIIQITLLYYKIINKKYIIYILVYSLKCLEWILKNEITLKDWKWDHSFSRLT